MKIFANLLCALLALASTAFAQQDETPTFTLTWSNPGPLNLDGPHTRQQLILTATAQDGEAHDVTHDADFKVTPEGVIHLDSSGFVETRGDGTATITATTQGVTSPPLTIKVTRFGEDLPVSFSNDIVPFLTRFECNSGGCHGKAEGQNGFRLSLLGYEPSEDYEYLVKESRGRRIFRAAPEHSLLLLKGTGELPHQGGSRLERDSDAYKLIVRWIKQGLPDTPKDDPTVTRITVFPKECLTRPEARQQLQVTAHLSDGSTRDITRRVQFESKDEEMAAVDEDGLVTMKKRTGSTSVMIRFQEHVDVFRATIPLGAPTDNFPAPANFIDERILAKLTTLGLPPSDLCDDATFLRRVTIDLAGRLPTLAETDRFSNDPDPAKRAKVVDTLLASPAYADYFAGKWSAILRNKRKDDLQTRGTYAFHSWIRSSLNENKPYDEMVRELVTATGEVGNSPAVAWYRSVRDSKEQMQDVAQIFLGIRMQCAQCHHHPYEKWSENDYYGFEAFFTTVQRKPGEQPGEELIYHRRGNASARNPRTGLNLKPTPLGGQALELPTHQDPRQPLADWLVSPENPFFARMLVNRYWKHFFGRGLVDPEDDLRVTNPATHPALLDDLAKHFVTNQYDLKELVRTICNSRTYQLSSLPNEHNRDDRQNYSRFYPRRLPAEVLLDGINLVTNSQEKFNGQPQGVRAVQLPDDRFTRDSYFLSVFGRPDMNSACECERTADVNLAQALHLVNSQNIRNKLASNEARAATLLRNKELTDDDRITELYRRALSRPPSAEELATARDFIQRKRSLAQSAEPKPSPDQVDRSAFEDVIWALLNTKEFLFNH
ncbi:DUF1549 and DUF1553 domain-containing protein [Akkermansiaceae bacterium]|nr:DUF1549 and DUF1553 domain-containing protein [Akkermansiaceae bacterium]MDB4537696.1 DUF1549 and DUF1553 domain-containing protein [Akkermansiaceae bacterium]